MSESSPASLRSTHRTRLQRVRMDEAKDPEALWPALEAGTLSAALHPDYVEEMLRVAALSGKRGKHEEQLRWLERAVALHPRSEEARQALAKVNGLETQEPDEPAAAAPRRETEGTGPVPDNAGLLPTTPPPAQRPQERASDQGG